MNLIDTHTHLYWDSYKEDLDEVIQRSIDSNVTTIINVGVDLDLSKKALEQVTDKLANIPNFKAYSTIGIHPHEAIKYNSDVSIRNDMDQLEQIYRSVPDQIVAVGECGLDYYQNNSANDYNGHNFYNFQRKLFQAQIDLAKKLNLPLIVHCRDDRSQDPQNSEAWNEVLKMIGPQPAILHCYSGLEETTEKILLSPNLLVSFAATITYPKNEYLREAVKTIPLDKIVLETDCPFLPPQSKRGQRNEPANVLEIAQLVADLKEITLESVTHQTTANVKDILRLRSG